MKPVVLQRAVVSLLGFTLACSVNHKEFRGESLKTFPLTLWQGEKLAQKYCTSCHLFPNPESFLPEDWEYVLSYMGLFFGIGSEKRLSFDEGYLSHYQIRLRLLQYLKKISIAKEIPKDDFYLLRNYYLARAQKEPPAVLTEFPKSTIFQEKIYFKPIYGGISLLAHDGKNLFIGNAANSVLYIQSQKSQRSFALPSPPVRLEVTKKGSYITLIGDLLGISPQTHTGELWFWDGKKLTLKRKGLVRSAGVFIYDVDNDGCEDGISLGFGYPGKGALQYLPGLCQKDGVVVEIHNQEGAVDITPYHYQGKDGFLVLFAGGWEGLRFFYYQNGIWHQEDFLEFPPTTGFTRLFVKDLNGDQNEEILLIAGDNADAGPYNPIKKEAGLYLYQEKELKFFYHYPGAFNASIADFNLDGLSDIAVVSYYPDLRKNNPDDALLFLNKGNFTFKVEKLPVEGRFAVALAHDFDQDGDVDLLLGRAELGYKQKIHNEIKKREFLPGNALVFLQNKTK